jgi:hypothetical protein
MEKKNRIMEQISDAGQKKHILANYLLGKEMSVNADEFQTTAILEKISEEGIILNLSAAWDFSKNKSFKLSLLLARFIELDCTILTKINDNKVEVRVDSVGIAKKERSAPRIPVIEEGFIKITNIISSKSIIEANMFNIPTLVRVNFEDYSKKIQSLIDKNDTISINMFGDNLTRELEVVKREMKIFLLQDSQDESSYNISDPAYLNYIDEIDDQYLPVMKRYRDSQITSELILPIIYINELEDHIPIGYVNVKCKGNPISPELIDKIKFQIDEMIERIKDANLIKTEEKFTVLDVSVSGLKMKINHPKLTETLPKQKGFGFDILFKMQAPFKLFATVAWSKKNSDGELLLGLEIVGRAKSKIELVRFQENIEILKKINLSIV